MTPQEAIEMLTAKAECIRRETSGIDVDCIHRNCDECDLCYKQGTMGDQMEALGVAISALQAQEEPKPPASGSVTCIFAQKMHDRPTDDCVSRQEAIDALMDEFKRVPTTAIRAKNRIDRLSSAQPEFAKDKNVPSNDCVSRQAAIDALKMCQRHCIDPDDYYISAEDAEYRISALPSAQPEQRCINCGRTANNGGWYKDGRTRCPIEEHYALPKDGYCHLWEKRKVWEDDYVKRPEEGEKR